MICGDLHIHSYHSFDSPLRPSRIVQTALRKGLDFIAVTDHNNIQGGIEVGKIASGSKIQVIVGSEIETDRGDILGLFLKEDINSRTPTEVIYEIHQQGGLAILPHPFKKELKFCRSEIRNFDAIEISARMSKHSNEKARKLAEEIEKPLVGGSDAHFSWEVGKGLTYLSSTHPDKELLVNNIMKVKIVNSNYINTYLSYFVGKSRKLIKKLYDLAGPLNLSI